MYYYINTNHLYQHEYNDFCIEPFSHLTVRGCYVLLSLVLWFFYLRTTVGCLSTKKEKWNKAR